METVLEKSQTERILEYLQTGKELTSLEALRLFGCFRLSARIFDLREMGYEIEGNKVSNGKKTFESYRLKTKDTLF